MRRLYGFGRVEMPVFEATQVFARSIGETTDIVQKQMFSFTDQGGRSLTLRPESTTGARWGTMSTTAGAGSLIIGVLLAVWVSMAGGEAGAASYYVAVEGREDGDGSAAKPWPSVETAPSRTRWMMAASMDRSLSP